MATIEIKYEVVIERPLAEVFAFFSVPENELLWRSGLVEIEQTPAGPVAVGTTVREVTEMFGKRTESTSVMTAYEPDRLLASQSLNGPVPLSFRGEFAPVARGTQITLHVSSGEIGSAAGALVAVAAPLIRVMARRWLAREYQRLKRFLESQAAVTARKYPPASS